MGIIVENNIINLINVTILNPLSKIIINESAIVSAAKYIFNTFNSLSDIPILYFGVDEFICALVSFPVYIAIPIIFLLATTVLAHMVFSKLSGSFCIMP